MWTVLSNVQCLTPTAKSDMSSMKINATTIPERIEKVDDEHLKEECSTHARYRSQSDSQVDAVMKRVGALKENFIRRFSLPVSLREKEGKCFTRFSPVSTMSPEVGDESSNTLSHTKPLYELRRGSTVDIDPSTLMIHYDDEDNDDDVFISSNKVYKSTTTGLPSSQWIIMQDTLDGIFTNATRKYRRLV